MQKSFLDGFQEAKKIFNALVKRTNELNINLATILIGKNPASQVYVKIKEKRAKEIGVNFKKYLLPASVAPKKVLALIEKLNQDKSVNGILVQLPLPKKFNTPKIIKSINPSKDVDGFVNKKMVPPTIQSILHLIKVSRQELVGKRALVLANSSEFAEALKRELVKKKIKVSVLLKNKISQQLNFKKYDLIIIALGKKYWLKPTMIKKGIIIIDVGISRIKNSNKIFGDVHPDCFKKSKYVSPVPGGVGPLTVAFLFKNLVKLSSKK